MTERRETLLAQLGFRFGINGPHAARTMMLDDLRALLAHTPPDANRVDYTAAIVSDNVLGKSTKKARELALRHLATLYGLDTSNSIFRALRRLWLLDESAQPLLALAVALARDPLLRGTQDFVLAHPQGALVTRDEVEVFLSRTHPDRFTAASIKSFAQNVAGTWTAAGVLAGHRRKTRTTPAVRPEVMAMCLSSVRDGVDGAQTRLAAAQDLKRRLDSSSKARHPTTSSCAGRGFPNSPSAGTPTLTMACA